MNQKEQELLMKERRELCRIHTERLDRIEKALNGNGTPTTGLLWIAAENGKVIRMIKKISWATLSMIGILILSKLFPHMVDVIAHGAKL